ncbi:class GN sortase [Microbulbifer elongatus]|uniref:class GN sortase n=1 Tax=Microbulbifer elongatus TaxID=86173 RepID=UPI001E34B88D|nr:class GN sortase [Microbulbifer elongatus]
MMALRILKHWLPVILMGAGIWQLGSGGWILAKAELAQYLISDAWHRQLASGEIHKPWPWADTWPVAQIKMGEDKPLMVLRGTSGQALAFGPGMLDGAGEPGKLLAPRTTVVAAHRDTHFKNLDKLQPGHVIQLQDQSGRWHSFRVNGTKVVDSEKERLPIVAAPDLLLVTCYPFNAMRAGGPLRYLVHAEYVEPEPRGQTSTVHL